MLFIDLECIESIPNILFFIWLNKYNEKVNIEIKNLELLEAFLIK